MFFTIDGLVRKIRQQSNVLSPDQTHHTDHSVRHLNLLINHFIVAGIVSKPSESLPPAQRRPAFRSLSNRPNTLQYPHREFDLIIIIVFDRQFLHFNFRRLAVCVRAQSRLDGELQEVPDHIYHWFAAREPISQPVQLDTWPGKFSNA